MFSNVGSLHWLVGFCIVAEIACAALILLCVLSLIIQLHPKKPKLTIDWSPDHNLIERKS